MILRSVDRWLVTDVSEQTIFPIFKGQVVQIPGKRRYHDLGLITELSVNKWTWFINFLKVLSKT